MRCLMMIHRKQKTNLSEARFTDLIFLCDRGTKNQKKKKK